MEEKKLTEKESLELITAMIARTKARYLGSGNILLMWGYIIVVVTVAVWIALSVTHQGAWNWLWFAIPLIGFPATVIMARKEKRKFGTVTYSDKITSRLWSIFGFSEIVLSLICLGFDLLGEINCWSAMLVYSLLACSTCEIAQGLIIKEKSFVAGGFIGLIVGMITACCVAGGVPLFINWYMPLFIITWIVLMIVPGHILNRKANQE